MSHLTFDLRDWKFIMHEQLPFAALTELDAFQDFDMDTFDVMLEAAAKFATERIAPLNKVGDVEGCTLVDGKVQTPTGYAEVWQEMREQGWQGAAHTPEFGGMGLPYSIVMAIHEAFDAACIAFTMYTGLTSGAGHLIEVFGSDELKSKYVARMYSGEFGGTMCLTEPQAGTSVGEAATSATPREDGSFSIDGAKIFISAGDADFYDNVVHMVLARVKGDPEGTKGLSLFCVPRHLVGDDGSIGESNNVTVTGLEHKMGINGSATCSMSFGADAPTQGWMVGEQGQGLSYMFQMMNEARLECGLQGVAAANAAYQQALGYARDRKQGPDLDDLKGSATNIINHPDVRRNLMTMKAYAEGTRALLAFATLHADMGHYGGVEQSQDVIDLMTPIAKAYPTDKGFKVTELAVQIFGGYGYIKEYPVEQYLRDVKIASIYEGTNGIQALDLLGRKMRLKGGMLFMNYVQMLSTFIDSIEAMDGLSSVSKTLRAAQGSLGEVAFWVSGTAKDSRKLAMLQATPFLELFGDVMVGHMLADQARVATDALVARIGTAEPTREQREADQEVAFYAGKVDTAKFFSAEVLIQAPAKAKSMMLGETAALDMVF
jgi:alkylation response protein AidB-like acyl-CoA dehydrogenase